MWNNYSNYLWCSSVSCWVLKNQDLEEDLELPRGNGQLPGGFCIIQSLCIIPTFRYFQGYICCIILCSEAHNP